jgi:elongation factor Ts
MSESTKVVSAEMVKKLRELTSAGMMDCKKALTESNGNFDDAVQLLRKMGLKDVTKRSSKVAAEGIIGCYVHPGDQVVSIVEVNCETDFVGRGAEFKDLAKNLAMHVAAMKPLYLSRESVPQEVIEKEKALYWEQIKELDEKQQKHGETIVEKKLDKYLEESVLLEQIYVKDGAGKQKISSLLEEASIKTGEKVQIRRFQRYEVGEGIEKPLTNLAADVESLTTPA